MKMKVATYIEVEVEPFEVVDRIYNAIPEEHWNDVKFKYPYSYTDYLESLHIVHNYLKNRR